MADMGEAMIWVARILGLLLIVYGLLGVFFALLGAGQGFPFPAWNDEAWTADVRRAADWAVSAALALGGLFLLLGSTASTRLVLVLALAAAAAKTAYDLALGDPATTRVETLLLGDYVALAVATVALLVSFAVRKRVTVEQDHSLGSAGAS